MRWSGWLVLAACSGDPSLDVVVHHPDGVRVAQTVLTVYFGGDIRCSEVEFGDRTDQELAAVTVDEVDVSSGGRIEVSRLGGKSLAARGYDAQRRFVTAGCRDIGEVTAGTSITIDTRPTAIVAIDPGLPDRPFTGRQIVVNMTDARGEPIDGMVSWQLSGPAGAPEPPPADGVPTVNGNARISITDLGMPGPEGLRIRVPWATAPLPLVTAFDLSGATTIQLGAAGSAAPACDVRGRAGKPPSLVCLAPPNLNHRDAVEITWQTDRYVTRVIDIPSAIDNQQALFVDHDGSASEPVYVVGATVAGVGSWHKLGTGSSTAVTFEGAVDHAVYIPRCGDAGPSARVAVQSGTALLPRWRFYTPAGTLIGPTDLPNDGEVLAGGCVADVDRVEHAAIAASSGNDATLALLAPTPGAPWQVAAIATSRLSGAGFVAVENQGVIEKRFAGTRLQATGTVVFEAVLATNGTSYRIVERTERETAAPPSKILAGKLDRDGDSDLMWDLATGLRRRAFQVSLAKQVSGVQLTAITSGEILSSNATASDLVVADLDGGGSDEMIVVTASAITIYSAD